jgi:cell wall assembly regulator SMI1
MNIASVWARIEAWHLENTPRGTLSFAAGAGEEEIRAFEREVGFRLPEDLRASFALHNGSEDTFLLDHGPLLPLAEVLRQRDQYRQWQEQEGWGRSEAYATEVVGGAIKPAWWNPLRLPLTDNSGDHIIADFDPSEGGCPGQIIEHDHEVGPRGVLAPSFGEWLAAIAEGLEAGKYVYHEEEQTVAPPGTYD